MIAVGKYLVLVRQIGATGIDQIDAGQPVLGRDLLGPQMLLYSQWIIGPALDRGVVADDDTVTPRDPANPGQDARSRDVVLIDLMRRQGRKLEEMGARIDQPLDTLARQEFAASDMALAGRHTATFGDLALQRA